MPGVCALVLFVVLMVYFVTYLLPSYDAIIAAGGTTADGLLEARARPGTTTAWRVVGFFVASLLFFNSLFMLGRTIGAYKKAHGCGALAAVRRLPAQQRGTLRRFPRRTLAMAVILVGLIGSSMYVTEKVAYIGYDESTDTAAGELHHQGL